MHRNPVWLDHPLVREAFARWEEAVVHSRLAFRTYADALADPNADLEYRETVDRFREHWAYERERTACELEECLASIALEQQERETIPEVRK